MNSRFAPIAVFAYNRPDHLQRTLEHLAANPEAKQSVLYIFCDGPKVKATAEQIAAIEKVREVASSKKWCSEVIVVPSTSNKGLAGSVISGVTQVTEQHGSVIVLEDDAVCSPFFLDYMNTALEKYRNDERVISIAGFVYPVKTKLPDTFFLHGADCIAWATWKRGWDLFEHDGMKLLAELEASGKQDHFDYGGTYPYTQMLRDQIAHKNDSWAIRWYASAYLKGKLSLYPGKPVISNIGFDGSGINSGVSDQWQVQLTDTPLNVETIPVENNEAARQAFARFFTDMRKSPMMSRIKQAIWSRLPGFIRKAWSGSSADAHSGWFGDYQSWEDASANSDGYDAASILERIKTALRKVKSGGAAFERDSITFDKPDAQPEITNWLRKIASEHNNRLTVTDFGGSLGSSYFQYRQLLPEVKLVQWTVVEQPHFVQAGKAEFEDSVLKFSDETESADVLLLFSVLPYLEKPYDFINKFQEKKFQYIIIDRTPVIRSVKDRLTVQLVPEMIYKGSYPAWFFSEERLIGSFPGYELLEKFESKFTSEYKLDDETVAHWNGYILKRK